jgi:hypothetical protein
MHHFGIKDKNLKNPDRVETKSSLSGKETMLFSDTDKGLIWQMMTVCITNLIFNI